MRLARHSTRYAATLFALALTIALLPADALANQGNGHASDLEQAQAALEEAKALTCDEKIEETVVEQVQVDTAEVAVGTEHEWSHTGQGHDNQWHAAGEEPTSPSGNWSKTGETRDIVETQPVYEEQETTELVDNPEYEQCQSDRAEAIAAAEQDLEALEETKVVEWSGQNGDEHLPCTGDLKWVWGGGGGAADVTNAKITVGDAEPVPGDQKGEGAWHFVTPGDGVTDQTAVQVSFDGTANERPPVTISECIGDDSRTDDPAGDDEHEGGDESNDDSDDSDSDETSDDESNDDTDDSDTDETSNDESNDDSDDSDTDDSGADDSSSGEVTETEVDDPNGNGDEPVEQTDDPSDPIVEDTDSSVEPEPEDDGSTDEDDDADPGDEESGEAEEPDETADETVEETDADDTTPESDDAAPARESTEATPAPEEAADDAIVTPTRVDAGGGGLADPASSAQGPLAGLLALLGTAIGLVGWRSRRQDRLHA